jgi:hypothetical protein
MLKTLVARAAILLAALPLALALAPAPAAAAGGAGTLFAITGVGQSVLSRVDPVAGTLSPIEDLAGPNQGQLGTLTGDAATHRLFAVRTSVTFVNGEFNVINDVLTINSQTGAYTVSQPFGGPSGEAAFDPTTNRLYMLVFNALETIDPVSGATTRIADLSNLCCGIVSMAIVPGTHTIYVNNDNSVVGTADDQLLTIDTSTGTYSVSQVNASLRIIAYDSGNQGLFGLTDCCPRQMVHIDPSTAAATSVATFSSGSDQLQYAMAVDPSSHTVFADVETFTGPNTTSDQLFSMNDVTGVVTPSPAINDIVWSQYFEAPAPTITPASIITDVQSAVTSGAIDNPAVGRSLVAELSGAMAVRGRGLCSTAGNLYQAFINHVTAQSGKSIAPATASLLVSEAKFLIANCP